MHVPHSHRSLGTQRPPHVQLPLTVRLFVQRFSATRRGARLARRLAVWQLHVWGVPYGSPRSDAVALVVAELAANAIFHGCIPGRDFELRLLRAESTGLIRVEVSDTHPEQPRRRASGPDAEGGRGLLVVAELAERWGVRERIGPGKTVWAEIAERAGEGLAEAASRTSGG